MAYLDLDNHYAAPVRTRRSAAAVSGPASAAISGTPGETGFSAIEWSVIMLSKRDGFGTLDAPGRMSRAIGGLFGFGVKSRLADPRLEALRRIAVYAWRRGYALPQVEIDRFIEAGFTIDQAETLVASVTGDRVGLTQIYATPRIAA